MQQGAAKSNQTISSMQCWCGSFTPALFVKMSQHTAMTT